MDFLLFISIGIQTRQIIHFDQQPMMMGHPVSHGVYSCSRFVAAYSIV